MREDNTGYKDSKRNILLENKKFKCGCVVQNEGGRWVIIERCSAHKRNLDKIAEKAIHLQEVFIKRNKRNETEAKARYKKRHKND